MSILYPKTSKEFSHDIPAGIYLLKVNNRNTRTRCEICSKLIIMTPSIWCLYCWLLTYFTLCYSVSIVSFEHVIAGWDKITKKYNEQEVFYKKTVLKNFAIFIGKHLCWSLFFNKNAEFQACSFFLKKRLQHKFFLDNIAKFLRTAILKNICERLLLRVFR